MEQQFRPRMKRLSDGLPLVEGSTGTPGSEHQVEVAQGRCGCTAGQFRRRRHHLTLAESMDRVYHTWRAQAERPVVAAVAASRVSSTGTAG
jgi:hypothetical protein